MRLVLCLLALPWLASADPSKFLNLEQQFASAGINASKDNSGVRRQRNRGLRELDNGGVEEVQDMNDGALHAGSSWTWPIGAFGQHGVDDASSSARGCLGVNRSLQKKEKKQMKQKDDKKDMKDKKVKGNMGMQTKSPTPAPEAPAPTDGVSNPAPTSATLTATPSVSLEPTSVAAVSPAEFNGTIVDFVVATPELSMLLSAVQRAGLFDALTGTDTGTLTDNTVQRTGLADALSGPGPFTLFFPTNNAFSTVPEPIASRLFTNDMFLPHLVDLLLYHTLAGEVFSSDLVAGNLETLNEEDVAIALDPLSINAIPITDGDNAVNNGVVHIIDASVLAPSWVANSLASRVTADTDLSTLGGLLTSANIDLSLFGLQVTLLAPTNDAFAQLPQETIDFWTNPENASELAVVLGYHVLIGVFTASGLTDGVLPTAVGSEVSVTTTPALLFNTAGVEEAGILANNGVVFKIDEVLEAPSQTTIFDFIEATPELSTLLTAAERVGFVGGLSGAGPFTLFAPLNSAFEALPADLDDLLFNSDSFIPHLTDLLLYHLLGAERLGSSFTEGEIVAALNGEDLSFTLAPLSVNGIAISDGDNVVSNGVIHIIDTGVLSPSWVANTLVDRVNADGELSTLGALLVSAEIELSVPGAFTLLAPTNAAFASLPQETLDFLSAPENVADLARVLAYHLIPGVATSAALTLDQQIPTFEGRVVIVTSVNPLTFNNAVAIEVDLLVNNGILHTIDAVLEFTLRIIDFIREEPTLTALSQAVDRAGFAGALATPGPFTLFAPTDDAFNTLPGPILNLLFNVASFLPHLQDFLTFHLLNSERFAADFTEGEVLTALNTENVTITLASVSVNGVEITGPDNDATNGVVHIINATTLEPSWVTNTIADRIAADPELSTLGTLLEAAGIDLSVAGVVTLVAPTNDAFAALPQGVLDFLAAPENVAELATLLSYHAIPGVFVAEELSSDQLLATFEGRAITVNGNPFRFNDAEVIDSNILANNGVLHKVDAVLEFPDTIYSFLQNDADLSSLLAAVERAGFVEGLTSPGPFTLFTPTDDAFNALPADLVDLLFNNSEFIPHLQVWLLNHILGVERFAADFATGDLSSLAGETLSVTLSPLLVSDISITDADNLASNGVIHKMNGVLSPSWVVNSLTDRVIEDSELSTLLMLVTLAGIDLTQPGELTLLAPSNIAFGNLPDGTLDFLMNADNILELTTLLTYHVIVGVFTAGELFAGQLPTVQGRPITVSVMPIQFNNAGIEVGDILANNGVRHRIDAVLDFANPTVFDIVNEDPDLETLEIALRRSGFRGPLSSPGAFTLFGPTNAAFAALPTDLTTALLTNANFVPHLQVFLLNHLLSGQFLSTDLVAGLVGTFNAGETVAIALNPITVNGNLVTDADNLASNGVVHKMDGVLTPFWVDNTLVGRLNADPELSVLADLVSLSSLTDLDVPLLEFTLLAANNAAFQSVPPAFLDFIRAPENQATLDRVLRYNLLFPGILTIPELSQNGTVATLEGNTIAVVIDTVAGTVTFNEANLVNAPLLANNGIFYKVDAFLQPPDLR